MRRGFSALLFLLIFSFCSSLSSTSSTNEASKVQSMVADIEDVLKRSFDYMVVGGGASGCALAATLSETYSVLLVERGGSPFGNPLIEERGNFGIPFQQTDEFTSVAQAFVSEEGVENLRGRVLGGSTAINVGFYSRASESDIKDQGWDPKLVKESYEWVESKIVFPQPLTAWNWVTVGGLLEAGIVPLNDFSLEHIPGTKVGAGIFDAHLRRHTSASLLAAANPNNLAILLNATVQNVLFDDAAGNGKQLRANGIRFIRSDGDPSEFYQVYLRHPKVSGSWGDVILSAGALGSPQILMLSGIGPKEHLIQFNIAPLIDAREVGQYMQDNPTIYGTLNFSSDALSRLHRDPTQVAGIANDFQTIIEPLLTQSNTSIQVLLAGKVAYAVSRGSLRLQSADPRQNPSVRFNYLAAEKDLDGCVEALHLVDKIARSKSVSAFLGRKQSIIPKNGPPSVARDYCKENIRTMYHYHGGCVVGSVVDRDYKVLGVEGLRVVDFSTFLIAPGTNPMATMMMLGRYQGVKMVMEKGGEREGGRIKLRRQSSSRIR